MTSKKLGVVDENQDLVLIGSEEDCSTMDASLSISGAVAASGVTQFANEACEGVQALTPYVPTPYAVPQVDLQDLKAYFQRPRLISRGALPSAVRTNILRSDLSIANLPTFFPQWTQRLSGVYGIRFKACYRLQVAATAFHQGVLALSFQYGTNSVGPDVFSRSSFSGACTNLPHVRMDLSELTMVEFSVPFLYANEFIPVSGGDNYGGTVGHLGLNWILPFVSVVGLNLPTYELYIWLEDIELFGADNASSTNIVLQSPAIVEQAPSVVAKELRSSRLISSGLDTVSKVSAFVAKHVPVLSSIAGPTAWAADIAAGVARYFGFSKPLLQDPVQTHVRISSVGEGHVDVPYNGLAVGPFQSNTLAFDGVTGATDVDEMALSFVTHQFSQICVGTVNITNAHGDVIYASPVSPSVFWFREPFARPYCNIIYPRNSTSVTGIPAGNTFLPSTLMNVCSCFRLWRGDVVYRITFAKTKFHGGRYMVSFNPKTYFATSTSAATPNVDGPEVAGGLVQPYGHSQIMDLKDGNVFEFVVPYASEQPYVTFTSAIGSISIVCLDPLQASSSVTNNLSFMIEVAGGENFELADYAGNMFVASHVGTIYQQAGDITSSTSSALVASATTSASQHTIGERFTSLKQLIMIPCYNVGTVAASTVTNTFVPPWWYYPGGAQLSAFPLATPINVATAFVGCGYTPGFLASMYAFARGSTDLHVYPAGSSTGSRMLLTVEQLPAESGYGNFTRTDYQGRTNTSAAPKVVAIDGAPLHVRLPAFQTIVRVPTHFFNDNLFTRALGNSSFSLALPELGHVGRLVAQNVSATASLTVTSSHAGDDATMSCFLGPEPIVIPNAASVNPVFPDWTSSAV
jgi:hypothetical protein